MNNRSKIKKFCKNNNLKIKELECERYGSSDTQVDCVWYLYIEDFNDGDGYECFSSDYHDGTVDEQVERMLEEVKKHFKEASDE